MVETNIEHTSYLDTDLSAVGGVKQNTSVGHD